MCTYVLGSYQNNFLIFSDTVQAILGLKKYSGQRKLVNGGPTSFVGGLAVVNGSYRNKLMIFDLQ